MSIALNLSVHESNINKLYEELKYLKENIKIISTAKQGLIEAIEAKKIEFRSKTDEEKNISVKLRSKILHDMDRTISMVQNQYDSIRRDFQELEHNLETRLRTIDKNELALNLLDHKMYEIDCDFMAQMQALKSKRKIVTTTGLEQKTKSQVAFKVVKINKGIADCEELHELQQVSIVEQLVEAKEDYEKTVNFVDDILGVLKRNINKFVVSLEDQKAQLDQVLVGNSEGRQAVKKAVNYFAKLQIDKDEVKHTNVSRHLVAHFKFFAEAVMSKCSVYLHL